MIWSVRLDNDFEIESKCHCNYCRVLLYIQILSSQDVRIFLFVLSFTFWSCWLTRDFIDHVVVTKFSENSIQVLPVYIYICTWLSTPTYRCIFDVGHVGRLATRDENFTRKKTRIFKIAKNFQKCHRMVGEGYISRQSFETSRQIFIHSHQIFRPTRQENFALSHVSNKPNMHLPT